MEASRQRGINLGLLMLLLPLQIWSQRFTFRDIGTKKQCMCPLDFWLENYILFVSASIARQGRAVLKRYLLISPSCCQSPGVKTADRRDSILSCIYVGDEDDNYLSPGRGSVRKTRNGLTSSVREDST
ncbi:uncharacterized protein B0H64DRAFT_386969 [Chaetomium fimeti]|uniref:Uncharacterized protein n=1 Tax=Chaetomium fimeti TaxID=1854472 RepID=A0AAE0HM52_9PEZI|nr:hypothetical protein B0H64DRAFT_386969 [Chaetomium fimeti]